MLWPLPLEEGDREGAFLPRLGNLGGFPLLCFHGRTGVGGCIRKPLPVPREHDLGQLETIPP